MNAHAASSGAQLGAAQVPAQIDTGWLLLACAALLAFAVLAWWKARCDDKSGKNPIRVLASRILGNKRWLTLVEVEGERLLLSVAGEEIRLLKSFGARGRKSPAIRGQKAKPQAPRQEAAQPARSLVGLAAASFLRRRIDYRERGGG